MKHTKRAMSCGVVTAAMIVTAVAASLSGNVTDTSQSSKQVYKEVQVLAKAQNTMTREVVKAKGNLETTTFAVATEVAAEVASAKVAADPAWVGKLMPKVEDALNVRKGADAQADVVGKLYKGSVAEVIEHAGDWIKIKSGNVEGYVKSEYCVCGDDAKALAEEVCKQYATSKVSGLRVRREAELTENGALIRVLDKGDKILVDTDGEQVEGWVAVQHNGKTGYVSAEYVTVAYDFTKAMTLEEEKAAERAKAEAKAKKSASVSASAGDVELLAALIYCEAGGESYEGQVAVGAVVVNRVESGKYPNSIEGVIYQRGQFTPAGNGKVRRTLENGKYKNCISAAKAALSGQDNTGGALHFNAGKGKGKQIGNQHFY